MDKLSNSVKTSDVDPKDFVALFVPGGHGKNSLQPPVFFGPDSVSSTDLADSY